MRTSAPRVVFATALALAACRGDDPNRVPGDSPTCAELRVRFRETLSSGGGRCARPEDCDCYDPVAAGLGCGGTTDGATAKKLLAIELDFQAAQCRWPVQCAARVCTPQCIEGRCR